MDRETEASVLPTKGRSYDEMLAQLEAAQAPEALADLLDLIEGELGSLEGAARIIPQLISKLRFYILVVTAQHLLIWDLRGTTEGVAAVH